MGNIDAVFSTLRLQRLGSTAILQPWSGGLLAGSSLKCDLLSGDVELVNHPEIEKDYVLVHGVLGLLRLKKSSALVVITGIEQVFNQVPMLTCFLLFGT